MKQLNIRRTLLALALSAFGASTMAQGTITVDENEPSGSQKNDSVNTATEIRIEQDGTTAVIKGVIGNATGDAIVVDIDFYKFWAKKGTKITIDIDNGIKKAGTPGRSVDTILTLFGPAPVLAHKRRSIDGGVLDSGSVSTFDPIIGTGTTANPFIELDEEGWWTVAVTPHEMLFKQQAGAVPEDSTIAACSTTPPGRSCKWAVKPYSMSSATHTGNGEYTLILSNLSASPIDIIDVSLLLDIKPGSTETAPINPKSRGNIPVALLSSDKFNALDVNTDPKFLKFGRTGNESSLRRCATEDVNGDGRPDLVCHFETQATGFNESSDEGTITGQLKDGKKFAGTQNLKVVPVHNKD